jgi:hypothetical protein
MSDTVRSYKPGPSFTPERKFSLIRGGFRLTRYLFLLALFLGVYIYWTTRDTRDIEEFIQSDTTYQLVAQRLIENRARFQDTAAWFALSDQWKSHPFPELLKTPVNLPEWAQRNLIGQFVFISGKDARTFSDAVYITKLSPVGSVLERMLRWTNGNESDPAGGLNMRRIESYDLFYAIRGRIALLSTSRRALVHTLTLSKEERISPELWNDSILQLGGEELKGTLQLEPDTQLGQYVSAVGFALQLKTDEGFLKLILPCTDSFYEEFGPNIQNADTPALLSPLDGPIQLSTNLNTDVEHLWNIGSRFAGVPNDDSWQNWLAQTEPKSSSAFLAQTLETAGPALALTWHGYDMSEITPAPQLTIITESNTTPDAGLPDVESIQTALKPVQIQFNQDKNWFEAIAIGGPARTTVVKQADSGRHLLVSTSRPLAEELWTNDTPANYLEQPANLFVLITPQEALARYEEFGNALAKDGLLKGYTAEEFRSHIQELYEKTARIHQLQVSAHHHNGTVEADIVLNPSPR